MFLDALTRCCHFSQASVTMFHDDKLVIACEEEYSASFVFRYFVRLAKLCKVSNRLLLQVRALYTACRPALVMRCITGSCCDVSVTPEAVG